MIDRVMKVVFYIGWTWGLFRVGFLAWTNPGGCGWDHRAAILVICIACWFMGIGKIKEWSKKP